MSEMDWDAIRANADWYRANREGRKEAVEACPWAVAAINSAEDVPALLAEVERLRAETARLCADLADELAAHAKTVDNFEAHAEDRFEENSRLRAEVERLRSRVVDDAKVAEVRAAIRKESLDRFAAEYFTDDALDWLAGFAARAAVRVLGYDIVPDGAS